MTEALHCSITASLGRTTLEVRFESAHHVTGVFGPSGAGKSSLLECITGLRRDAKGSIRLGETAWLDDARRLFVPPDRRDIGYVPQAGLLLPHLTARENVAMGERRARARGVDFEKTLRVAVDVLELGTAIDKPASVLSGGERQRVALARALCSGPRLLVLDEPLASLDVALQRKLVPFLRRIREEFAVPMLLVSHSPLEIQALCDHVIALREGRIVTSGAPATVLSDPRVLDRGDDGLRSVFAVRGRAPEAPNGSRSRVVLESSDVTLVVRGSLPEGERALVGIAADSVILATDEPKGLSAANVLAAHVRELVRGDGNVVVHLTLAEGHPPLLAELTEDSVRRLGVAEGTSMFAVVKASACELLGEPPASRRIGADADSG